MQSPLEQQQSNQIRIKLYRDKLSNAQQIRARVADQISQYSKRLGLNILQTATAIRIGSMQLDHGHSEDEAYRTGARAAHTIALASANEKLRTRIFRLH